MSKPVRPVIRERLKTHILVLDGAMGTAIQDLNLTAKDFGGEAYEGCNENLVLTRPDLITGIHEAYAKAGADILETNTFGGTPLVLGEYGLSDRTFEINETATKLAREVADRYTTQTKPRYVAGSLGPTTKAISVTGGITFEDLTHQYERQVEGLIKGGSDYLLLETCQDTRTIKAAILGIQACFKKLKTELPIAVSGTIEPMGTMLAGQSVEALLTSLSHLDLLYIGLNCATGPEFMTDHIRSLSALSPYPIACVPNAGLPDEHGCYLETPEMVSQVLSRFIERGWINLVGGCCGTHIGHIEALVKLVHNKTPRKPISTRRSALSGIDYLEITDEMRPVIVGERTNVIGSKKFKDLICSEKFEDASEIARAQIKKAAQIIDVCLANPDRDELNDMKRFLEFAMKKIRTPLMIDSTDENVIKLALTYSQGKAIINSINLEDGEERFEKIIPLAKTYGAALVVGCIDEDPKQGMGVTRQRKLEIAKRSYELLTQKYGIPEEDIYWDPLVFPCATGDAQYVGSAVETIEGLRLIKKYFPKTKSVLGISNVSFGLPNAGREVLNSVFLYHCVQAGLDLAIVNSEKLERYASLSEEEKNLAENLLFNRTENSRDPIAEFAAHFRERKIAPTIEKSTLPLEERLARYIIEGSKDGLIADLDLALQKSKPLEVINGPLMKGMDEVGKLFNDNKLIVAEVLQSAEAMKAAVSHLESFMDKADTSSQRGKVLLATVKGDVHDIGKNLVEIILANNGFKVINLGIKVPPEQIIQAVKEHEPDVVGLSGLLVKSAQQMVVTADDLSKAGVETPILVGGAALSENYVDTQIAKAYATGTVAYASDAMSGLDLAKTIVDPEKFTSFKTLLHQKREEKAKAKRTQVSQTPKPSTPDRRSSEITLLSQVPRPSDFERHVLKTTPLDQIWKMINPLMLYGRHLGVKGGTVRKLTLLPTQPKLRSELSQTDAKALEIWDAVEEVKKSYKTNPLLQPKAIYQFFGASAGDQKQPNRLEIYKDSFLSGAPLATFEFPRQTRTEGLCLSDYTWNKPGDTVCFFITTVGLGVRDEADRLKAKGDYLKSHIIQALAIETAEAYAEWLHAQIRKIWGFADPPEMTMMERFQAKYQGKRYSFGYPACPRLDDQALLWKLLNPSDIGVELTDGFMMDPESSVSAIVFHHPQATYFSVGQASHDSRT